MASEPGEDDVAVEEVHGFAVLTQTCDIVRPLRTKPFLELATLVEVDAARRREVEKRLRPRYAFVPAFAEQALVADLDRTMVVEKPVVASWVRVPGCRTVVEARFFALAIARKFSRPAFPDDFVRFVRPLAERVRRRSGKASPEGRAVDALREIRVRACPDWNAPRVVISFLFVRHPGPAGRLPDGRWDDLLEEWLDLLPDGDERFDKEGLVTTLGELTAEQYVASDRLDLDHLSG